MKPICRFGLFVLMLIGGSTAFAARPHFRNYSVEQGLSYVQVKTIFQDRMGFIWTGGYGGLSRFDGRKFVNYSPVEGLVNYSVNCLEEDAQGRLWIGTIRGVSIFDGKRFRNFLSPKGLASDQINQILRGPTGNLYFATSKGVSVWNGKSFSNLTAALGLPAEEVTCLAFSPSGTLWVGTHRGMTEYHNGKVKHWKKAEGLNNEDVRCITLDEHGTLWVGTAQGLHCITAENPNVGLYSITATDKNQGMPTDEINAVASGGNDLLWVATDAGLVRIRKGNKPEIMIPGETINSRLVGTLCLDREQNLWLGTYEGLYKYRSSGFVKFGPEDGLTNNFVFQSFRDAGKRLWVTTGGGGIYGQTKTGFEHLDNTHGLSDNFVWCGQPRPDGSIWFGTSDGLCLYRNHRFSTFRKKDGLISDYVFSILTLKNGKTWVGGRAGVSVLEGERVIQTFAFSENKGDCDVSALMEDNEGNLWLGCYQGSLYRWNGHNMEDMALSLGIRSDAFMALAQDPVGRIYIGTFDGVFVWTGKKLERISTSNGLSSNLVYQLCLTTDALWIGTNQGLNKLSLKPTWTSNRKSIQQIGRGDGFLGGECNTGGSFLDEDGSIFFGTVNGLIRYRPGESATNTLESKTFINGVYLMNRDTLNAEVRGKLPYNENSITFSFTGLCYTHPEKVRYRYKLEGFDRTWSPETPVGEARYSRLPPGRYVFRVKSCNNEGLWNSRSVDYRFDIAPPFWRTWWFLSSSGFLVALTVALTIRYRIRKVREEERKSVLNSMALAANELKALRAQMNPHFIFNSLNSIQHFVLSRDEQSAARYLNKFARLIRKILNNSEEGTIAVEEEVETLRLYLELEALRFNHKFTWNIHVEPGVNPDFTRIPTMLIQPFVENAILHGIAPAQKECRLEIRLWMEDQVLMCSISDNGVGMAESEKNATNNRPDHRSLATKITNDRLDLLSKVHHLDVKVTIQTLNEPGKSGTLVVLQIPTE